MKDKDEPLAVPLWEKEYLTVEEASALFGIGQNKLRQLSDNDRCDFVLWVGSKRLLRRRALQKFLDGQFSI